ncbi:hypothetical protein [Massilia sp. TWR1-2-2]|uniref:hypothetical protein n=1 Tax=Massilia sp. TWR1-2-2 TaxID=2804584 RepID=UPI003CEAB985
MKRIALWARLLCVSVLYSLAGCAGTPLDQPLRGGSFPLAERQAVTLAPGVAVRYDSFADSRCPTGAMCIWAGKVSYNFTLTSKAGAEKFALDYEGEQYVSTTLPDLRFGISFAGVKQRPLAEHAVVLEVAIGHKSQ